MGSPRGCQNGDVPSAQEPDHRLALVNFPFPAALAHVLPDEPLARSRERLTPAEQEHADAYGAEKRRHDWIRGRAAAKAAARSLIAARGGSPPAFEAFSIVSDPSGAPRAVGLAEPVAVSLTHGHGQAAGLATRPGPGGGLPGIDLERIRPRPSGTLRFYLHPQERAWVEPLPAGSGDVAGPRDVAAIVVWAIKEAAFKVLAPPRGTGLLDVEVELEDPFDAPEGRARIAYREGAATRAAALGAGALHAGWRRDGDLVLAWVLAAEARLPDPA